MLLLGVGCASLALAQAGSEPPARRGGQGEDPLPSAAAGARLLLDPNLLAELGVPVTEGAAPGYVPDRSCAVCHGELYRSFQQVGMARSFYRPREERRIEDFDQGLFTHAASGRTYRMRRQGEKIFFERYQLDAQGEKTNAFEIEVDWILGSGHTSRTYLYQTRSGELFQLPVAWYSQSSSWGMAPGYDHKEHEGVLRRVRRECMFCHNAYPEVPAGSDLHHRPHTFPAELPEGIGCQRCHGPGAEHTRLAFGKPDALAAIRASITNPGNLSARLRDDVCYECHMQPSVALPGIRRFDRPDYSFRPGEALAGYQVLVDVVEEGREPADRFEINHHPYRLEQSRCFQESGEGALSCLTCHDPHRKVPAAERAAHYRAACTGCHTPDSCSREAAGSDTHGAEAGSPGMPALEADCVACHMPRRRTEDVVHVVMTDHRIQRQPGGPELLAPLEESTPVLLDLDFLYPGELENDPAAELYRTAAVVRAGGGVYAESVDHLQKVLARLRPDSLAPYLDLARGQLKLRRFADARRSLAAVLEREADHPRALDWLGTAWSEDDPDRALASLRRALALDPDRPETRFNLGVMLLGQGRPLEAMLHLRTAIHRRPNMAPAFLHLGNTHRLLGDREPALRAYRRALAIDPGLSQAYLRLGEAQLEAGAVADALETWKLGLTHARVPGPIARALEAHAAP